MINLDMYQAGWHEKSPTGYKYFVPGKVNDTWSWSNQQINNLLEKAAIRLGELNSFATLVPSIDLFIQLHVTKEAVVSSRIEGTQTRIEEALLKREDILPDRRDDWQEVRNYIKAMNGAIRDLKKLPISSRLLRNVHKTLLHSVRGEKKQPGEFRTSQNWIGGNSLADAVFIPPHHTYINELMSDLEKFIHAKDSNLPELIKIAIAHYQFETIHPFQDGNGRIGRLLITLFLVDRKVLTKPLLYLSTYFDKKKGLYYDNLTFVRTRNDMTQWIKYFLVGIAETAKEAADTLSKVIKLKSKLDQMAYTRFGKKGKTASKLINYLFEMPIIDVRAAEEKTGLSYKAANSLVNDFIKARILSEMTGNSRNRLFYFQEYLKLFDR